MIQDRIRELAAVYEQKYIAIRQHLHAHPELSYQEYETAAFVRKQLDDLGIAHTTMADTGVVGIIEGLDPASRVVALRADMDALPILEENEVSYKSVRPGIMHACGHDVHTTCLLGAAQILSETRDLWRGTVKLIFQPGEERNPGGASLMIRDGVLDNPRPSKIFALHVHPGLETGRLSFRGGMVMASADELYITIKGKGGHAAAPHLTTDTILVAAQLILSLQQLISRNNNPFNPSVLSITSIQGGNTTNVIPTEVKLMGTFRAMNEEWRFKAHELIRKQTMELANALGATADVHIDVGYPFVLNDEALNQAARTQAGQYLGADNVETTELRMGAEDFGYYSHQVPGCFFRLGVGNRAAGITANVHTPVFNIDERAIRIGMGVMAWLAASVE
jgi:amidohydrolase